jgi:hypothetical protein
LTRSARQAANLQADRTTRVHSPRRVNGSLKALAATCRRQA